MTFIIRGISTVMTVRSMPGHGQHPGVETDFRRYRQPGAKKTENFSALSPAQRRPGNLLLLARHQSPSPGLSICKCSRIICTVQPNPPYPRLMPTRAVPERFLVAFSLAGEQRELVLAIAEAVENRLGRGSVFLDEWFEHYIAGDDADLKLQEIYGRRCELAVVCVSERYGSKPWTQAEHQAIRARNMKCSAAAEKRERDAILPIRVGDGEVAGILFNAIVPDVRGRSAAESAELIIARLHLLRPDLEALSASAPPGPAWPKTPSPLSWPMANHSGAREAFGQLLTSNVLGRLLRIRGVSETGKSHITRQMLANVLPIADIACGRFDFKGTTDMDREVRAFVQDLGVTTPPSTPRLHERFDQILDALRQRARPTLLIFDPR